MNRIRRIKINPQEVNNKYKIDDDKQKDILSKYYYSYIKDNTNANDEYLSDLALDKQIKDIYKYSILKNRFKDIPNLFENFLEFSNIIQKD